MEWCVPGFVQEHIERRTDDGVRPREADWQVLLGRILHKIGEQLVADGDHLVVVPGVLDAVAARNLEQQRVGQADRTRCCCKSSSVRPSFI